MPTKSTHPHPEALERTAGRRQTAVISLPGLNSAAPIGGGCCATAPEDAVRAELESWPGITVEAIDPAGETVTVAVDPDLPDLLTAAAEALTDLGFGNPRFTRQP